MLKFEIDVIYMEKKNMKISGVMLVGAIIVLSFIYAVNVQPIVFGDPTNFTYTGQVKQFDTYKEFTDFLLGNSGYYPSDRSTFSLVPNAVFEDMDASLSISAESGGKSVDYSQTNVQVAGVDEPDIVKTDGEYLYIVSGNRVIIVKATPAENASIEREITVNDTMQIQNIFINGNRLIIFTQSNNYPIYKYPVILEDEAIEKTDAVDAPYVTPPIWYSSPETHVLIYDLEDLENPELIKDVMIPGRFVGARLIEDFVYAITNQYSYDIIPLEDDGDIVPWIAVNGEIKEVSLSDIGYVDLPERSSTMTNIVSINVQDDDDEVTAKIFILGNSQVLYVSTNNIYIAYYTNYYYYDYNSLREIIDEVLIPVLPDSVKAEIQLVETLSVSEYQKNSVIEWILQNYTNSMDEEEKNRLAIELSKRIQKTTIHRISINDGEIEYEAEGEVPGQINDQFQFSEYDGYLRVSSTIDGWAARSYFSGMNDQNGIYVLDMNLEIVGSVEGLAPGENIYATRFIGDKCYLVTFRQIDPFFVIDLADPEDPTVLGELKIPGYSTYLHPYDETHIIGIGMDSGRVKISLFDVSNMSDPIELAKYEIKDDDGYWGSSTALYEHKAFLFDKDKNLLVIPAGDYSKESAHVFDISTEGIEFKGEITHETESEQDYDDYYYWNWNYGDSIKRTLYIEDVLYTISDNMVKMNDLNDLTEINSLELN